MMDPDINVGSGRGHALACNIVAPKETAPSIVQVTQDMRNGCFDLADRIDSMVHQLDLRLFGDRPTPPQLGLAAEAAAFHPDGTLGVAYAQTLNLRNRLSAIEDHLQRLHGEL